MNVRKHPTSTKINNGDSSPLHSARTPPIKSLFLVTKGKAIADMVAEES